MNNATTLYDFLLAADATLFDLMPQTSLSIDELENIARSWGTDEVPDEIRDRVNSAIKNLTEASRWKCETMAKHLFDAGIEVSMQERTEDTSGVKIWVCEVRYNLGAHESGATSSQCARSPWAALCLAMEHSGAIAKAAAAHRVYVSDDDGNLRVRRVERSVA